MTSRDPHKGPGRDPAQSLIGDDEDAAGEHPSLALGTHGDENTRIESPGGRGRTPPPPRAPSRPPPPSREDPEGRIGTLIGNYQVQELLGRGGMGYVYRAEHIKLGREVALKLLRSDYAKRKDAVARFIQEARTVNRIRHRNIVDVPDIIEMEDGTTCIVMELLIGTSLGRWARSGIELPRALAVLVQICDGLAAAHSVDIVHRDLKPDNVFVVPTNDGAELVKLLDFGVAKLLNRDDEDVGFQTAAGSVIGTPAYMSPEQAGGMLVDARSDIYSLGAIMYELFCGMP
ncbi:MAG TPA: serine/threonine-protein kinase, partial [Kofleriaceae bacterium]